MYGKCRVICAECIDTSFVVQHKGKLRKINFFHFGLKMCLGDNLVRDHGMVDHRPLVGKMGQGKFNSAVLFPRAFFYWVKVVSHSQNGIIASGVIMIITLKVNVTQLKHDVTRHDVNVTTRNPYLRGTSHPWQLYLQLSKTHPCKDLVSVVCHFTANSRNFKYAVPN